MGLAGNPDETEKAIRLFSRSEALFSRGKKVRRSGWGLPEIFHEVSRVALECFTEF